LNKKQLDVITSDVTHWHVTAMRPPLCPNEEEVKLYKKLVGDVKPVYLLGMTANLIELCDVAVDLSPVPINKPCIQANWLEMMGFRAGAFIGDGVINLAGQELINKVSKMTDILVCRVFLRKFDWMKYATYFPTNFPDADTVVITQQDIAIVRWQFTERL